MHNILEKQFEVCSYDVDIFQKLKISSLFAFFQESASLHAEQLGVGFYDLKEKHRVFWALSRIHIKIQKYPSWKDKLTYKTWPTGYNRLYGSREFNIENDSKVVVSGSSDWIIMDLNSKQIVNPELIIKEVIPQNDENYFKAKTKRVKFGNTDTKKITRKVRYNDLDMNRHVNSIKYLEWVFDCLPTDLLTHQELAELNINYLHEIPAHSEVEIQYYQASESNYYFMGKVKDSSKNSFVMELIFRKN